MTARLRDMIACVTPSEPGYHAPQAARPIDDEAPLLPFSASRGECPRASWPRAKSYPPETVSAVFRYIADNPHMRSREIAEACKLAETCVTYAITVLSRAGRIRRSPRDVMREDGRVKRYCVVVP